MFVTLTMVIAERDRSYDDSDEGEDDGIVPMVPSEPTSPTVVNTDLIRNFYPRKKRRDGTRPVGTRITFVNGSGMAVTDTFEQVTAKITATA